MQTWLLTSRSQDGLETFSERLQSPSRLGLGLLKKLKKLEGRSLSSALRSSTSQSCLGLRL